MRNTPISRRRFVAQTMGVAAFCAPWARAVLALAESEERASRRIRQIDVFIVKNPVPQRGGSTWTFVKLTTQGGITGWGEPYHMPYGPPMAIDAHKHVGQRHVLGTHAQMTTSSAIRLAKRVEPYDPLFYEEPVPPENVDEMARVARMTSIPIATGERLSTKYEFAKLLEKQAASLLQMDLGRVGGILEAKKIAAMGEAYYAQISPHLWSGPLIGAASIQLDTCTPNFLIQECIERLDGFHAEVLKNPVRWEKGFIIPPEEPGLGVEPNEDVVRKHTIMFEQFKR